MSPRLPSPRCHLATLLLGCAACGGDSASPPTSQPTGIEATTPITQVGPVGAPLNEAPAVRVVGADGAPLAGVPVSFTATGSSVVVPPLVLSDDQGIARVISWSMGAGPAELRASAADLAPVVFTGEGRPRSFDLVIRWLAPPSPEAQAAAVGAEALIESIIWEDLPDERVDATPACRLPGGGFAATIDETIDDVLILASVEPIDGLGGIGGMGFPCLIRDPGTQTLVGLVRLDEAEFNAVGTGLRRELFQHEMVHALGLVPALLNITTPSGFSRHCLELPSSGLPSPLVQDSHFSCAGARRGFDAIGGTSYSGAKVPLENGATTPLTANTLNHHWRKTSLRNELMTGWFTTGLPAPLSRLTVGALEDLGYAVSAAAAQPFQLTGVIATLRDPAAVPWLLNESIPSPLPLAIRPTPDANRPRARRAVE